MRKHRGMKVSESNTRLPACALWREEPVAVACVTALAVFALAGAAAPVAGQPLIFEREVFVYPAEDRRDPFEPPGNDGTGPRFEALSLRMIIFSEAVGRSVVVLADGSTRSYRLHRGETLGNATVVEISPTHAVFVVEDYGNRRREVLDLRPGNSRKERD